MLSPVYHGIVFGSALAENILNANLKSFSDKSRIGPLIDTWITYPQSVTAGMIAYSILGSNVFGQIALAGFVVSPLVFKSIKTLSSSSSKLAKTAEYADACVRLAAKFVNLIDFATYSKSFSGFVQIPLFAIAANQIYSFSRDLVDMLNYNIYGGKKLSATQGLEPISVFHHKKWMRGGSKSNRLSPALAYINSALHRINRINSNDNNAR